MGVDNQQAEKAFTENDQYLLSALADYAAIAIDNARLYEEVKHSETRYRDLFANAYDLIFTLDRRLNIQSINKVGPALTGYTLDELRGHPLSSFCAPSFWEHGEQQFTNLIAGRAIQPFELHLIPKDGERVILEISARLVRIGQRIEGIHCIARNLTERRRLEEQLLQAEKLSAIGQLVAGVAHELNNPLTSISGYTQLLQREKNLSETMREDLSHIHIQAERAARIVQNLLVFAREHKPERRNGQSERCGARYAGVASVSTTRRQYPRHERVRAQSSAHGCRSLSASAGRAQPDQQRPSGHGRARRRQPAHAAYRIG